MARKIPIIREVRWLTTLPHLVVLAAVIGLAIRVSGSPRSGLLWGAASYLAYSLTCRLLVAWHHRRGMSLVRVRKWEEAIPRFQSSYAFFTTYPWLDRYRSILLLSASAASYREMALLNMAFCHAQLGRGAEAKATYQRALEEFPDSPIAQTALRLIAAAEAPPAPASLRGFGAG